MKPVRFTYDAGRGGVSERHVLPERLAYGESDRGPEKEWVLIGFDYAADRTRFFPLQHIINLRPAEAP